MSNETVLTTLLRIVSFPGGGFDITDNMVTSTAADIQVTENHLEVLRSALDQPHSARTAPCYYSVRTFEAAEELARLLTTDDQTWMAADAGQGCYPRFTIFRMFRMGEDVSYGFNGDSYPCGIITKIGAGRQARITTSTGKTFNRCRLTGRWAAPGGTWTLCRGHEYKQNPSF